MNVYLGGHWPKEHSGVSMVRCFIGWRHITSWIWPIATDRVVWSVGLSVCNDWEAGALQRNSCTNCDAIWNVDSVGPRHYIWDGVKIPMGRALLRWMMSGFSHMPPSTISSDPDIGISMHTVKQHSIVWLSEQWSVNIKFLVHGQVTIIFVVSVCLFVQSFSQPSLIRFRSN